MTEAQEDPEGRAREAAVPVPRNQALGYVREAREVIDGETPPSGVASEIGGATLTRFLTFHPFMTFFCWLAHHQFPASHRPETRVARLREGSSKFYWLCVSLDVILTLLVSVILIGAAALVVYKSVWLPVSGPE